MLDQSSEPQKLPDVLESYGIKRATLMDWVDAGVLKITKHVFKGRSHRSRGREMLAIEASQISRLERFLRYKSCLLKAEVIDLIALIDAEDTDELSYVLEEMRKHEEILQDALQDIQIEISRIHAKLKGDETIDPDSEDWEG
ncbi:hypothetical protein H6G89_23325 [Oscillatoria sp. FACHB-1407]|uniref:hypothetical protein n=1 Tax=Oscillatoria sp. FACHB-1407 TaxID=2692847 RepID=UPI0016898FE2|nr:hypothetical protein [Oscillatoria sp. FACHB-1407]MBD2463938.1 hypothetical protein [Oscillatoria sp. FACHB-1407]